MRKKKYIYDVIVQVMLVLVVMQLFRKMPDRIHASFWASTLFVLLPVSMMVREWIFSKWENKLWWFAILQFWVLFAIPIFTLRILNPRVSLNEVEVLGMPVRWLHGVSNYSYLLLMLVSAWSIFRESRRQKKSGSLGS